jgi:hypothetical protein
MIRSQPAWLSAAAGFALLTTCGSAKAAAAPTTTPTPTPTPAPLVVSAEITPTPAIVGVPFRMTVHADASRAAAATPTDTGNAIAAVIVRNTVACPASYAESPGGIASGIWRWSNAEPSTFTKSVTISLNQTGTYRACTYYGREGTDTIDRDVEATDATTQTTFEVQRPTVSGTADFDGALTPSGIVQLRGTFASNAPELVDVHLNAATTACAATAAANAESDRLAAAIPELYVFGTATLSAQTRLPATVGDYHLCVYASGVGRAADPDLVLDRPGTITVAQPTPALTIGRVIYADGANGTAKVACTVPTTAIRRGAALRVHCDGVTGRIAMAIRRGGRKPESFTRFLNLSVDGFATLPTKTLSRGTWHTTIKWSGYLAAETRFVIR